MLEHVREALLHGFGTERSRLEGSSLGSLDDGLDRQTPIAHLRHEGVQLREPRLRTQRQPVVVTPKDSEQAPHLVERVPTRRFANDCGSLSGALIGFLEQALLERRGS